MAWKPGHQFKSRPFVVDCILGEGGFGITYRVHHQFLNQDFVIKTPNARLQNDPDYPKYLNRFIQEGQRVAKICHDPHPHIVRVTDLFEEAGIHCLVMDYVPGESLWKYVQNQGALSEAQAVRYIRQIGDALRVVHKAGLVHRDATPLNIMVRSPEKAVLIDFGIAKGLIPTTSTTTDKAGNQGFAPYEQIGLGSREVMVDVYTLAASLYYGVTGQRPVGSLGRKMCNAELVPPQQIISGLSDATNQAILSGMALEPEDRPQSIEAWLALLTFEPPIICSVTSSSVESSATVQPAKTAKTLPVSAFDFQVVTVEVKSGVLGKERKLTLNRRSHQAYHYIETLGDVPLEMVAIPGGTFLMGSPETEEGHEDNESPQHWVTIQPFFLGKYPITQAQWQAVAHLPKVERELDPEPSYFKGENRPVEQVSWYDCVEFCARLSQYTGWNYRLPSEAEWEYACRAGTTTPFHFGETITTDLANYDGNSTYGAGAKGKYREETTPVGSFQVANAFGLYDMHGNVWEWCLDQWHDSYEGAPSDGQAWIVDGNDNHSRLLRGGSWNGDPWVCRCANRGWLTPVGRYDNNGFRVVCGAAWTL
ncbi:MAG: bifunctional serine/threonine-protein kinase/formylglycine-generating enzyme family protein [Coleofasciculus sp. A1-SPW-01]|uniref:SUMF1/EgtB/PvdO family nonheme iron enzyme n=1 Tax=Coleofasciculus sp. A1-SPW-01 TaxID=3070819 RepID=UPI0032FC27DC